MGVIARVLRNIRQAIPSGVVLGRTDKGDGPVQFIQLSTIQQNLLDAISSVRGSVLYRGASGWAALAPGTAGQALLTGGAGADPAWGAAGGSGKWWAGGEPVTTDFGTSVTEGSASNTAYSDDSDIGLILAAQCGGDDNLYAKVTSAPSFPFTITAHFTFHGCRDGGSNDGHIGGVVLRESGAGLRTVFGIDLAGGVGALGIRKATATSYAGAAAFANYTAGFGADAGLWVQIVVTTATNIVYKVSRDGKNFTIWQSNTAAGQVSGLDQIGIGITRRNTVDQAAVLVCDYWDVS